MQHFDAETTRAALGFPALIAALSRMFVSGCEVPARHHHTLAQDLTLLIMPAWQPGAYLGIKTVNIAPGNTSRGLPGLFSTYQLFDATTGVALAQIDGNEITSRRTAAASALAASYLARPDARILLIVGTGRVARLLAEAYRTVRPIELVLVWNRNPASAEAMVEDLNAQRINARTVSDLAAAVRQADIVSCATLSGRPLIQGEWLAPGSHLDLIGSFTPAMREADAACFANASLWVDTDEALRKSGDLLQLTAPIVQGTLADLCKADVPRRRAGERTVFKSVGTALEDLAAATLVYSNDGNKA